MSHCALSDRPESFVVHSKGMSTTSFDVTKKVQIWEEKNSQRLLYTLIRKQYHRRKKLDKIGGAHVTKQ